MRRMVLVQVICKSRSMHAKVDGTASKDSVPFGFRIMLTIDRVSV
jgi:hypothetical protein